MMNGSKLSDIFWKEAVHIVFHILNKGMLRTNNKKKTYELWRGRPTLVK